MCLFDCLFVVFYYRFFFYLVTDFLRLKAGLLSWQCNVPVCIFTDLPIDMSKTRLSSYLSGCIVIKSCKS